MHVDSDAIIIDRQAVHPLFLPWYTQTFKGSWMDGGGGGGGLGGGGHMSSQNILKFNRSKMTFAVINNMDT